MQKFNVSCTLYNCMVRKTSDETGFTVVKMSHSFVKTQACIPITNTATMLLTNINNFIFDKFYINFGSKP